ncbi:carbonic anhydrase [Actinomycetes bacterium KLBMP 9797]
MPHNAVRRRALLAAGGLAAGAFGLAQPSAASAAATTEPTPTTPAEALRRLLAGNHRFVTGHPRHPHQTVERLRELAAGQHPFLITLGCADSRVPPELLFDQGLGDIFDNRVAGNEVDDLLLGSIEYAVEHFAPPVLMVLGHERCGAVTATIEAIETGATAPGHIGAIVTALRPIIEPVLDQPGDKVDNAVVANVKAQARALVETSDIVREKVEAGTLAVVGARYDLDTGRVTLVR